MIRNFIKNLFENKDRIAGVCHGALTFIDGEKLIMVSLNRITGDLKFHDPDVFLWYEIMINHKSVGCGKMNITPLEYEYFKEKCRELQEEQTLKIFGNDN